MALLVCLHLLNRLVHILFHVTFPGLNWWFGDVSLHTHTGVSCSHIQGMSPSRVVEWLSRWCCDSQGYVGISQAHLLPRCHGCCVAQQFWDDNLKIHGSPKSFLKH